MTGMTRTRERYELATTADGGVLLDLDSGDLHRLNATAALVWELALAGASPDEIAAGLVTRFEIDPAIAARDSARALKLEAYALGERPSDFFYEPSDGGYRFVAGGAPVFRIAGDGSWIAATGAGDPARTGYHLRGFLAKVAALLGMPVLHASSVRQPDGTALLFVGKSGAGKTTSARAFARAGCELLSEDKVVVETDGDTVWMVADAEKELHHRTALLQEELVRQPAGTVCDTRSLLGAVGGHRDRIGEIFFIRAEGRQQQWMGLRRLGQAEALEKTFLNGFYGSGEPRAWRRQLQVMAALARAAASFDASMPEGLAALEAEALRYVRSKG